MPEAELAGVSELRRLRRERLVAWVTNSVGCLYCAWMGATLLLGTRGFLEMFKSVGAELPPSTAFVVSNRIWLYPVVFGTAVLALLVKELLIGDKRLSTMLTFSIVLVVHWVAYWFVSLHYVPLFALIQNWS